MPELNETYLMVDVEADGPVPGRHSMLALAAVAFKADKTILGTFERNIQPLAGAVQYPATMKWWEKYPEAWAACQRDAQPAAQVMTEFLAFVQALPDLPAIFCANPISYDWPYVQHYLHNFTEYVHSINDASPLALVALDVRSYACALLNKPFRYSGKPNFPKEWKAHGLPHTHRPLDDAMEHAMTFCAMLHSAQDLHSAAARGRNTFL